MDNPLSEFLCDLKQEMLRRGEDVQPWHSFWYHRPTKNFPPSNIRDPEEYDGSDRLSLVCTQTDLSATAQKKLLRSWCELLPTLTEVRYLWFNSRVNQELFDAATQMPHLEGLYIKWSGIKSIESISNLKSLQALHIGSSPSLQPLEALSSLANLQWLELENIRAAHNLSFVRKLPQLRGLGVSGDSNSLKYLKVKTLEPLECLQNLEWLSLSTLTVSDEQLNPISKLSNLKYLLLSNRFAMDEVAKLSGLMPHVDCSLFAPISDPINGLACKKCNRMRLVMLTGKGKPFLCLDCDAARIEKHVNAFNRIAEAAAP